MSNRKAFEFDALIQRAIAGGSHFFDPATMRFFNSRVLWSTLTELSPNRYLYITSERFEQDARQYTLRELTFAPADEGLGEVANHETIGDHMGYATREAAIHALMAVRAEERNGTAS